MGVPTFPCNIKNVNPMIENILSQKNGTAPNIDRWDEKTASRVVEAMSLINN